MTARRSRADYPDGVLGIYDNGGLREYRGEWRGSADRYTVVYDGADGRGMTFAEQVAENTAYIVAEYMIDGGYVSPGGEA